ncbi:MAG: DUF177 domain-containing protein [Clostridia bacterium]|nr:DUF177 domain-containing protein [Clostridia bacterium]
MEIQLKDIQNEFDYTGELTIAPFECNNDEITPTKPVTVQLHFKKENDKILVTGTANTTFQVNCHRCGTPYEETLPFEIIETFANMPEEEEYKIASGKLFLDDMIFDNFRLNLPMHYLCKEDCKGICFGCGKNLNVENCECGK